MKAEKLVTKEWLAAKVAADPYHVIGRALLAIYQNQTSQEQANSTTFFKNGIGFAKPDARTGAIGARQFAAGKLADWVVNIWKKVPDGKQFPRICKYAEQLNKIAQAKAELRLSIQ